MDFISQPIFGIGITLISYMFFFLLSKKVKGINTFLTTSLFIIAFLILIDIPYEDYQQGGRLIEFMLGPATVALGVPIYREAKKIKNYLGPILLGNFVGALMGLVSAGLLVWAMGGDQELIYSMMPKSATTPIAVVIVENLGGLPALGATFTAITGMLGSIIGPTVLKAINIQEDIPIGAAMGTSSHGIGTARVILDSQIQGSISAFSMGVTGILTSILVIPLYYLL